MRWPSGGQSNVCQHPLHAKAGQIDRRGAGANDGYPAASKSAHIFVIGAVGDKFLRRAPNIGGIKLK